MIDLFISSFMLLVNLAGGVIGLAILAVVAYILFLFTKYVVIICWKIVHKKSYIQANGRLSKLIKNRKKN